MAVQSVIDQKRCLTHGFANRKWRAAADRPYQPQVPLLYRDYSGEENPKQQASAWLMQVAQTPFNAAASLIQFAVAKVGPDSSDWLLNQHHIVADATSAFHVYRAVARAYEQLLRPGESLQPIPLQPFHTYLNFEREYQKSPQFQRAEKFRTKVGQKC